jgi:hypothetical protein
MTISIQGGCACRAVRYEAQAEPLMAIQCQCKDCQRATGTGHNCAMAFPKDQVKLTGKLKYYDVKADSGSTVSRGFCPECGSPVASKSTGFSEMTILTAGSLDDPSIFKPGIAVYAARGQDWDHMDPEIPRFPLMPPPPPSS